MPFTAKDLEPFTYFRNPQATRGFLLVDICNGEQYGNYVQLIEIGQSRKLGIKQNFDKFIELLNSKELIQFIPKIK